MISYWRHEIRKFIKRIRAVIMEKGFATLTENLYPIKLFNFVSTI